MNENRVCLLFFAKLTVNLFAWGIHITMGSIAPWNPDADVDDNGKVGLSDVATSVHYGQENTTKNVCYPRFL